MSDDQGFEVVDKRKVKAEEGPEAPAEATPEQQPAAEAEAPQTEAAPEQEPAVESPPPAEGQAQEPEAEPGEHAHVADVYTVVTWMVGVLATSAWQKMGLQVDPGSGTIEKDLEQARIAIDCVMALSDRISAHLDDSGRRELRGIISDLQLNFVNQSK